LLKLSEAQSKESKQLICTSCPMGCSLRVEKDGEKIVVTGAKCKRGSQYAQDEMLNPKRTVTTTVVVLNGEIRRLPVRTKKPFPLRRVSELIQFLSTIEVEVPVQVGQVIATNCLGEGVDIIATRTILRRSK
jgi:CxxC motif-containing protein